MFLDLLYTPRVRGVSSIEALHLTAGKLIDLEWAHSGKRVPVEKREALSDLGALIKPSIRRLFSGRRWLLEQVAIDDWPCGRVRGGRRRH